MSSSIGIWKSVFANPFSGYSQVTRETKIAGPLTCLLLATLIQVTLLIPITTSPEYTAAAGRVQLTEIRKRVAEMDQAQVEQAQAQLSSPGVRALTIASSYLGGIVSLVASLFVVALLLKLLCLAVKAQAPYPLLLRILVFAGIVSAVGGLLKVGITLAGDWRGALQTAMSARDLQLALQSPLSLVLALPSSSSLGKVGYTLLNGGTDIFGWIYYIFVYAGLRSAAHLTRPQALTVAIVTGVAFLALSAGATLLF